MQIPLKWLNELVNINLTNSLNLINKLTLGGFEVEELIEVELKNQKHIALDISATANRSDSLSIQGLSLEISALLNEPTKISDYSVKSFNWKKKLLNHSKAESQSEYYSSFLSIIIKNLQNFNSPKWLKEKLLTSGLTPENTIRDFQNYILIETGYPFAFYDLDKICKKLQTGKFKLDYQPSQDNYFFTATNGIIYELYSSTIVCTANNLPIGIAGITEQIDYTCSNSTTSLLLEGSLFNAAQIRQQSRLLGLRTDRSARYEKSLKATYLIEALYRLISLLRIENPNLICEFHTFKPEISNSLSTILLKYQTVNEILGPVLNDQNKQGQYITPKEIEDYLSRLNFNYTYDEKKVTWEVQIPEARSEDITREIDLIEEIGRLYGFNNFLTTLPKLKAIGNEDLSYQTRKKITSCLLNLGLTELINYSLVKEKTFLKNKIPIVNPLLSDCSYLRSSLLPNLIKTVQENLNQGNSFTEGFEYGHIFLGNLLTDFREKEYVAGIFGGLNKKLTWSQAEQSITWFEGKGNLEKLFNQLNITTYWKAPFKFSQYDSLLHPYRSSEVYLSNGNKIGIFGQIHPIIADQLDLMLNIYLFEFDFEIIKDQIQKNKLTIYNDYCLYPKIIKDLSFVINNTISFDEIKEVLYLNGSEFLSEVLLLDEYRSSSLPENHISLCIQLIFQSKEKTLETKEIEIILKNLNLILMNKFRVLIRN